MLQLSSWDTRIPSAPKFRLFSNIGSPQTRLLSFSIYKYFIIFIGLSLDSPIQVGTLPFSINNVPIEFSDFFIITIRLSWYNYSMHFTQKLYIVTTPKQLLCTFWGSLASKCLQTWFVACLFNFLKFWRTDLKIFIWQRKIKSPMWRNFKKSDSYVKFEVIDVGKS